MVAWGALGDGAEAALTAAQLEAVAVTPTPDARVPADLVLTDERGAPQRLGDRIAGMPAILVFADFTCRTLCGPTLALTAGALEQSGLRSGRDYRLLVVGLDPKDGPAAAQAMKSAQVADPIAQATIFLMADEAAVRTLADAVGYRYVYDPDNDQFAHPVGVFVLAPDGKVARILSGLALNGDDLRLALVEAGHGRIGTIADQIRLICYGFDPAMGVYTASVGRWLMLASAATMMALFGGIGIMALTPRPGGRSKVGSD
jgi:protein SCO1/2